MANARGGTVIIGVEDSTHKLEERTFENLSAKNKGFR
jgi:predicted HTH transcriptional regulator